MPKDNTIWVDTSSTAITDMITSLGGSPNYYYNSSMQAVASSSWFISPYVPIEDGFKLTNIASMGGGSYHAYYDGNKNYISNFTFGSGTIAAGTRLLPNVPVNAKFARFSLQWPDDGEAYITTTTPIDLPIEPRYAINYDFPEPSVLGDIFFRLKDGIQAYVYADKKSLVKLGICEAWVRSNVHWQPVMFDTYADGSWSFGLPYSVLGGILLNSNWRAVSGNGQMTTLEEYVQVYIAPEHGTLVIRPVAACAIKNGMTIKTHLSILSSRYINVILRVRSVDSSDILYEEYLYAGQMWGPYYWENTVSKVVDSVPNETSCFVEFYVTCGGSYSPPTVKFYSVDIE